MQTRKSNPNKPARVMIYGVEGVGKSTFGAKSEHPVFISPEGGTDQLTDAHGNPVEEMPSVKSWADLKSSLVQLVNEDHNFKTLVIDSADWIEGLAHEEILRNSKGKTIVSAEGGYGGGYRKSQNMHQELITVLSNLREKRDMNIVLTAHAHVKPAKDPSMPFDYDSYEIKCHEMVSSLWREWVDALFFTRFHTLVKSSDDVSRARAVSDGSRVAYTVKQPSFQAKNRYGMPPELEFTENFWTEFIGYARKGAQPESADSILNEISDLYLKLPDNKELKDKVASSIEEAIKDVNKLLVIRKRLQEITNEKE